LLGLPVSSSLPSLASSSQSRFIFPVSPHLTQSALSPQLIGMDPDRKHTFGDGPPVTPLGFAVQTGSMEVVKTLLSNQAAVRYSWTSPKWGMAYERTASLTRVRFYF